MPSVARFNVTPMKGTSLHHPERIRVERFGVPGNRHYFLVDPSGKRISATRHGKLVRVRVDDDPDARVLAMQIPGVGRIEGPSTPSGEPFVTDMWGRNVSVHEVAGPFHEPLSEFLGEPVRVVRCDREGDGNDERAITVVSLASVDELARRGGHGGPLDAARFRMTIELNGCAPHEEDTWGGQEIAVGGAVLRIAEPVPRCIVTTWDPNTGDPDFATLKVIRSYRERTADGLPFGVYAEVVQAGEISLNDSY